MAVDPVPVANQVAEGDPLHPVGTPALGKRLEDLLPKVRLVAVWVGGDRSQLGRGRGGLAGDLVTQA